MFEYKQIWFILTQQLTKKHLAFGPGAEKDFSSQSQKFTAQFYEGWDKEPSRASVCVRRMF